MSLLAACPSLADLELRAFSVYLTLVTNEQGPAKLSGTRLDQIRSLFGHLRRFSVGRMETDDLARLLQPPVTAQWQDIGRVKADARTGDLLLRLPTLTTVDLRYAQATAHVGFLPHLPHLNALTLDCYSTEALLASLQLCTGLTHLDLNSGFHPAHWTALLDKLTKIKKLKLRGRKIKQTLECFATGPVTESLQELTLEHLDLPPSELSHLSALRRLRTLRLISCSFPRRRDATIDSLSPPTRLLPALTELFVQWRVADDEYGDVEWEYRQRRGASYEWMQQRLTQ